MSLESRLREALHRTDAYQPSVDLFARLSRSIEEDRAHRRRVRRGSGAVVVGLTILGTFLLVLADHDPSGMLVLPKWSIQVALFAVLTACLLVFGPAIRRLGSPYIADVFHLNPATGERFSRLLDIAYYLFFGGGILSSLDLTVTKSVVSAGEGLLWGLEQVAGFIAALGAAHVGNLLVLPLVGLLFGSLTRRNRRRLAGFDAPPISEKARQTDRLITLIMLTALLLGIGGGLSLIALLVGSV